MLAGETLILMAHFETQVAVVADTQNILSHGSVRSSTGKTQMQKHRTQVQNPKVERDATISCSLAFL